MRKSSSYEQITFRCDECQSTFDAEPTRIEDSERTHPYAYFANCPTCQTECNQAAWQIANFCSLTKSTGPKSSTGKKQSAENLTLRSEEAVKRNALNALKHGAYSKSTLVFPARPGQYPQCSHCDVDYDYCAQQPACIKRTELLMQHIVAFERGDPSLLRDIQALQQAQFSAMFSDMLAEVANDGVTTRAPKTFFSQDGKLHLATYKDPVTGDNKTIEEVKAHALLKPISEFLTRNNMSLNDLNMTPKIVDEHNINMGQINSDESDKLTSEQYLQQQNQQLADLRQQIQLAKKRTDSDPILIEHSKNG